MKLHGHGDRPIPLWLGTRCPLVRRILTLWDFDLFI
jgi:hypothetical protein